MALPTEDICDIAISAAPASRAVNGRSRGRSEDVDLYSILYAMTCHILLPTFGNFYSLYTRNNFDNPLASRLTGG